MKARMLLGIPEGSWLSNPDLLNGLPEEDREDFAALVSRNRLARIANLKESLYSYAIDSGGFTELADHGWWRITTREYVAQIRRYLDQLGRDKCLWVAQMDAMCEEVVIRGGEFKGRTFVGTREFRGLKPGDPEQDLDTAIGIHLRWTVDNYIELTELAPEIPWIPVLQGNKLKHYKLCERMFAEAGVDLAPLPLVGLGSVCRREATSEIEQIVEYFAGRGIRLHGFGVKAGGLGAFGDLVPSVDSMAWSMKARRQHTRLPGCTHKDCRNCWRWAVEWYRDTSDIPPPIGRQLAFDFDTAA